MGIRGDNRDNRRETGVVAPAPQTHRYNSPFHPSVESDSEDSSQRLWITSASFTGPGTFRNGSESAQQETLATCCDRYVKMRRFCERCPQIVFPGWGWLSITVDRVVDSLALSGDPRYPPPNRQPHPIYPSSWFEVP